MYEVSSKDNKNTEFNWVHFLFLTISPFLAIAGVIAYIVAYDFHWFDLFLLASFYFLSGLGITAGYHRYYAHRTHKAHPIVQVFYLFFGGIALQQPVLLWARNHRIHHRFTDTDKDPHNIKRGFFYAHMGWIFYSNPEFDNDFSVVKDLIDDKLVQLQKKFYWPLVVGVGMGLPALLGWIFFDRPLAGFLWGGLLRIVIQSHATYSVNSFAHVIGKQRFSLRYEARDSLLVAIMTNGEGFHSYHHRFAFDYRNGWKWYHWDPSKWFILLGSYVGLTSDLKRASEASILKAKISTDYQRMKKRLVELPEDTRKSFDNKMVETKQNIEKLSSRIQETKEEYRRLRKERKIRRKEERALWRKKLREQRKELELAQAKWATVMAQVLAFNLFLK